MNWYKKASIFKKASITLYSPDAISQADGLSDVLKIASRVNGVLFKELEKNKDMPYWEEHHVVSGYGTVTNDGEDYNKPTGIMNFYTAGIPPTKLQDYIDIIMNFLAQNNIVAKVIKKETSRMYESEVIRIGILINKNSEESNDQPSVNMANDNAFFIFNKVLGYNVDLWEFPKFEPKELLKRAQYYLGESKYQGTKDVYNPQVLGGGRDGDEYQDTDEDLKYKKQQLQNFFDNTDLSGKSANTSYTDEMVKNTLQRIIDLCKWCIENGFTYLSAS